ncbi:SDR family NAD(P)-dependent oxidoreductase [Pseudomonas sp.]|uniref:SDR family NAD(P)-dependent oxidoreductase n=1 Tax=Pseudomonas sp. TaxID=306 RepID=UPI003D6F8612
MRTMVVGASKGLGKALIEGLGEAGDTLVGVSRSRPEGLAAQPGVQVEWVAADLMHPRQAAQQLEQAVAKQGLDTLIYNLGIWEERAFAPSYDFLEDGDGQIEAIVSCNITATLLLIKRLLPTLLQSARPRIILTGSTSGLTQSGRPEVTFGASKFALRGIADALSSASFVRELTLPAILDGRF